MLAWLLICLHWSWILGIAHSIRIDKRNISSYGQILSLFSPLPGLFSFINILQRERANLKRSILNIPSFASRELCFIFTGKSNGEWFSRKRIKRDYFDWKIRTWSVSKWARFRVGGGVTDWLKISSHFSVVGACGLSFMVDMDLRKGRFSAWRSDSARKRASYRLEAL